MSSRNTNTRKFEIKAMEEFLKAPCMYVQKKQMDDIESIEKSSTIGSKEPTKINLKDGTQITSNDNLFNYVTSFVFH